MLEKVILTALDLAILFGMAAVFALLLEKKRVFVVLITIAAIMGSLEIAGILFSTWSKP